MWGLRTAVAPSRSWGIGRGCNSPGIPLAPLPFFLSQLRPLCWVPEHIPAQQGRLVCVPGDASIIWPLPSPASPLPCLPARATQLGLCLCTACAGGQGCLSFPSSWKWKRAWCPGAGAVPLRPCFAGEGVLVGCTSCCWLHNDHRQPRLSLAGCSSSLLLPSQFPSHHPLTRPQQGPLSQQTLQE